MAKTHKRRVRVGPMFNTTCCGRVGRQVKLAHLWDDVTCKVCRSWRPTECKECGGIAEAYTLQCTHCRISKEDLG
jgi:hypothetical protein